MTEDKAKYTAISLPIALAEAIDELITELGYWPSRGAFVREACLEKIREERRMLRELREALKEEKGTPSARNRGTPRGENGLKKEE